MLPLATTGSVPPQSGEHLNFRSGILLPAFGTPAKLHAILQATMPLSVPALAQDRSRFASVHISRNRPSERTTASAYPSFFQLLMR